jgi:hypothetical protein
MEHYYPSIKGWFNWPELYERAVRLAPDPAVFVEIGCYLGRSTSCLAVEAVNSGKRVTIHAIDLWNPNNKIGCDVEEFKENLWLVNGNPESLVEVVPMRGDSGVLHSEFEDGSLDFVWVDGNHKYASCINDVRSWWPKLKEGGWMGGDDLIHGGVRRAVEEFFGPECHPGKSDVGDWVRFQSATCYHGKNSPIRPASGGWVWWARARNDSEWSPVGVRS